MAKRSAAKVEEGNAVGGLDSGPVKIKWIRIVENPAPPSVPPPPPPVQRVYFEGIEDGATIPIYGHFLLSSHTDWVKNLVDSMEDTSGTIFVGIKIDPARPTVTFQEHDYYLSSAVISIPPVGGTTSVHSEVIALTHIP